MDDWRRIYESMASQRRTTGGRGYLFLLRTGASPTLQGNCSRGGLFSILLPCGLQRLHHGSPGNLRLIWYGMAVFRQACFADWRIGSVSWCFFSIGLRVEITGKGPMAEDTDVELVMRGLRGQPLTKIARYSISDLTAFNIAAG